MEDYKVKVGSEAESKEAQELLFELGYVRMNGEETPHISPTTVMVRAHKEMGINFVDSLETFEFKNIISRQDEYILINIPQLRDMVVLKRNDIGDSNAYRSDNGVKYYITSDNKYYYFPAIGNLEWTQSCNEISYLEYRVKQIKKEVVMKEFLVKSQDGRWRLETEVVGDPGDDIIEVPEGADTLAGDSSTRYFWKHGVGEKGNMIIGVGESLARYSGWTDCKDSADVWLDCVNDDSFKIIWQRETLNDKVASAEVARQSGMFVGTPFSDLSAFNFGAIDDFVESNVEQGAKHSHYKKDISHLNTLDIYRVTELFNPHSCGAHIAKKALCSGQRGHKDLLTDIQDIIDTAERWKEMLIEDEKAK